jgi:RND superfamily putative drug exporter
MAIIGAMIWYHPRWFARYVPDADIEDRALEALIDAHNTQEAPN